MTAFALGCAALVLGAAPQHLAQTGLYRDAAMTGVAAGVRPFSPQYPLWTDGAAKLRWISLPKGTRIDAKDADAWRFPVGTRFWKQFSFGGRKVETRYLEKTGKDAWLFAAYVWNDEQTDATLAPAATGVHGAEHDIPSVPECRACHEGKGRDSVLGYAALQLSSDRDPLAPHAEASPEGSLDLDALLKENRLRNAPASWRTAPPIIDAPTPIARAALGYLHGNCSYCHNDRDPVSSVGLSFRAELAPTKGKDQPVMRTAVGVRSKFQIRELPPEQSLRLAAGNVEHSAVIVRMRSRDGLSQMPPLGTRVVDEAALALLGKWVRDELPAD